MTISLFPLISNICDVLPHIEGRREFSVSEKGWYTVVKYVIPLSESFTVPDDWYGNMVRRECRGLIFDTSTGEILRRGYHKFFNLGEIPNLEPDFSEPHRILCKLDGSMVTAFRAPDGGFRLATKAGITDTSMRAEVFAYNRSEYGEFINLCLNAGYTPIFEWCSRRDRIVEDYGPEDSLILTAIREMRTGVYESWDNPGVPVVSDVDVGGDIESVRGWKEGEGIVIRFESGEMIKVKADEYVRRHHAISNIKSERNVLNLIISHGLDDILPLVTESDKVRLCDFESEVWGKVGETACVIEGHYKEAISLYPEKRDFATRYVQNLERRYQPLLYALYDSEGSGATEIVLECLRKDTGRWILENLSWT
jgi:RNA ligase